MSARMATYALGLGLAGLLSGCAPEGGTASGEASAAGGAAKPTYLGIETRLLEDDLVEFDVAMKGARSREDVVAYGKCAAAQYALIRGYGFARHVHTRVERDGSLWRARAVYVISAALPEGVSKIDAEVAVAHCAEQGIPTV